MKHKAFTIWEALAIIAVVAIGAAILMPPGFGRGRENARRSSCASNLKQIGLAFAQYAQDYDDKFPPNQKVTGGWAELVLLYSRPIDSDHIFQCPSDRNGADKTSDYFFNARLAGVETTKLAAPTFTIATGDGLADQPFDAHLTQLPTLWPSDSGSPANRHLEGANYGFADGHVKWFKPQRITLEKPSAQQPTFLLGGNNP